MPPDRITLFTGKDRAADAEKAAARYGVNFQVGMLLEDTYKTVLDPLLAEGDFCACSSPPTSIVRMAPGDRLFLHPIPSAIVSCL
jgi:hypothetical protein